MRIYFLSLAILVFLTGCDLTNPSGDLSSLHKSITIDGIEYSAEIPSNQFSQYDTLFIRFKVRNHTSFPREFNFSNIQQLAFELINRNEQTVLYYPYIVSPALSSFTVEPGGSKELSQWSLFKDFNGRYIGVGYYTLRVFLANGNSPKIRLSIFIN